MTTKRTLTRLMPLAIMAASISQASAADIVANAGQAVTPVRAQAMADFKAAHARADFSHYNDGRIGRVYGRAFSHGRTALESTQRFVDQHTAIWGVAPEELLAQGPFEDGQHVLPIGYQPETDSYKFTGHYFTQMKQGVPVFRSKLVLLTRNETDNPLVLASAQLHDLSNLQLDPQAVNAPIDERLITSKARQDFAPDAFISDAPERVVYAGTDANPHQPTLADVSEITFDGFQKYLIITDAATGEILYKENLIHTIDISGNVSALATEGPAADFCGDEVPQGLPYLRVNGGGNSTFTDINGDFTLPNPGVTPVNVNATLTGQWFTVSDAAMSVESLSESVTPPGPVDFLFNAANASQFSRAQVNSYLEANRVRDLAFNANPSYPTLNNNFPIYVNLTGGLCPGNAWYDGSSINFCTSGSGYPNTAWSSVVHHEYGHHLVAAGGSGQGQYGEGMGDVMSTIILDVPDLGIGFFGSCNGSLRNADNNHQYPCFGGIHDCGQLISGCVWDTRNALVITEPDDYQEVLGFLAVNSILVHSGETITPQITIDWLTLDDDDSDIGNGTPHYFEIDLGFSEHSMDAPELNLVDITFPQARPEFVNPAGSTTLAVEFQDLAGSLDPATPTLMADTGSGFTAYPMTQVSGGEYEVNFPAADCGSQISYYISAESTSGVPQASPTGAPDGGTYSTTAAFEAPVAIFSDNAETDMGWSVSGNAIDGQWNRGIPVNCNRGDPGSDYDGSGRAWLTDNSSAGACNSDVDDGSTILTSPVMDATGTTNISYARWYDNTNGASPNADVFVVEVSDDGGSSWVNLETVGPNEAENAGGWYYKQFNLNDVPGFLPNDEFRIRFNASDLGAGSVIEAGIDAVQLLSFDCNPCVADMNGDGLVDFFDISSFLGAFSDGDPAADLNGDGLFDFFDTSAFLSAFSAGCP